MGMKTLCTIYDLPSTAPPPMYLSPARADREALRRASSPSPSPEFWSALHPSLQPSCSSSELLLAVYLVSSTSSLPALMLTKHERVGDLSSDERELRESLKWMANERQVKGEQAGGATVA